MNGKTPVFVDESGFSTESVRQFAYAPRGVCVSDKISSNRYRCTTLIAACGASLLFLPPYSPELNPIERDFANIKRKWEYNAEASIDEIVKMYK